MLKNDSPHYIFTKGEKGIVYPFALNDAECAISYIDNGKTKYIKVAQVNIVEGTYYENGPLSVYENTSSAVIA
ncbi:hypothetical protein [Winogradskyella bathintestinalis]|uniref:Uncharacterized protein n=1 Tax=Winogradskyella bathintestinalis TaxID=3035208 RepID=A0ABT7ZRJ0_9FLAO|nr:hypothetical protein [Winogradskyella bathintestinalis]MDN3491625.1 hypothetical protein [Winogradskyella bathintestinalis]